MNTKNGKIGILIFRCVCMCVRACVRACVSVCLSLSMSGCLLPYILNLKPQPHNPSPSTPYSHSLPQTHWKKVKAATKESKASTEKIIQKHSEKKLDLLENQTKFLRLHDQLQVPIHSCAHTLVSSILAYTLSRMHSVASQSALVHARTLCPNCNLRICTRGRAQAGG